MNHFFVFFWAIMIFGSIAWYGFLVFYLGIKAGREIRELISALEKTRDEISRPPESRP